jgi:drug/metabolite transporter (DMT)-like permease
VFKNLSSHSISILQALLVITLWSSSWVLIKFGLVDIPPLTFAGLRYMLAFLVLLPVAWKQRVFGELSGLPRSVWKRLFFLGVLYYPVTQGAQFVGLAMLPAITVNLLLNFTTAIVALMGVTWLAEHLIPRQWAGVSLSLTGAVVYFIPVTTSPDQGWGVVIVVIGVLANAVSGILGRAVNRAGTLSSVAVTVTSMGIGAVILLGGSIAVQGLPRISVQGWLTIAWLAVVNTAFAFTLWNHTLRTLRAVESSVIAGTMLVQIPLLAWLFLGETPTWKEIFGMVLAGVGTLLVQLRPRNLRE